MSSPVAVGPSWLPKVFPFLTWLPMVTRKTLGADLSAGLTGAVVVLPQGVAFATIAGMPPEYGLYAGMIPAIIAALFGSSWHLVSGPTTAASIVLFSSLSALAEPGSSHYVTLALTLAIMVGLLQLTMGLFRLGSIVNFISHSVVIGFTAGAGVLIAANQVKNFFGLPIPRGSHFHEIFAYLFTHLADIGPEIAAVGALTLATGILVRRFAPRFPYMIAAILAGSVASTLLNAYGGAHIPVVGALPSSLPPLSAPSFDPSVWRELAPTALAVTMFALTEALSISRALAVRSGQHISGNQEFIGQGLSNIAGSFFSGYVATGSFNRSGLNYDAGAKTPLAAVVAGAALMVIVLVVAPLAAYMPNAAMAGVLFLVAYGLIDKHHIAQIFKTSRSETAVMVVTFLATLTVELGVAILTGVLLSLLLYLNRTSRPGILIRVPDPESPTRKFTTDAALPECPQLRLIRIDGSLFFGAVAYLQETLRRFEEENPGQHHLAIVMSGVNFIDVAGAEALAQEARRHRAKGGGLYFIRIKEGVLAQLERGGYLEEIGREHIFQSKTQALRAIYAQLDHVYCRSCGRRVFVECGRFGRIEPDVAESVKGAA
ncbi:SulP family inorganic anion transporter [Magnetospirillum sp. UT-4]|uniref:SulP family inorganic anion transporter n=1 Tax=Magnetospirillum sp. UT-4 TaxID=2681467 RepID=UPI0013846772|nr:SulP family inorganic anion transporter [Magnetospirillum sp. UT-4]CAA7623768.1 Sulfate transporter [Magnetospirillum sp. UT-4]